MPYPHPIRLRGPWQCHALSQWQPQPGGWSEVTTELPRPGRIKPPADWGDTLGPTFCGRVRYARHFNKPTGLQPQERVFLVVEGVDAHGRAALNGQSLGEIDGYALPASFDVTELLTSRNELVIDVDLPPPVDPAAPPRPGREDKPGGLIRDVRLEVRADVWADDCFVYVTGDRARPELNISVRVSGESTQGPLNLLVNVQRREFFFAPVEPRQVVKIARAWDDVVGWRPGVASELATVDIALLRLGESLWERTLRTAFRPVYDDGPCGLRIWEQAVHWPIAICDASRLLDQRREIEAGRVVAIAEILSEEDYLELDLRGQAVVQLLPAEWAVPVSSRLAHHPSIIARAVPAADLDELPPEIRSGSADHPWVAQEIVLE
jgi:hypothetical protein